MKIAILGGGFTGLAASYYLSKKGHEVALLEKEPVLGGLAVGFKQPGWDWYLERAIHHLLGNDDDIVALACESGFEGIFWKHTETASLYGKANNYRIIPVDTPQDFLRFPYLPLHDKLRAGFVLAWLIASPFLTFYEKQTCEQFLRKTMGNRAWKVLWSELFRKKFGKYAENILSSFMWARIKKRSKKLGYIKGGFQTFVDHLGKELARQKVTVKMGYAVEDVVQKGKGFKVNGEAYDAVVCTLSSPIIPKVTSQLFSTNYLSRFNKLKFLHAVCMVFETKDPLLESTYWLNVCAPDNKIMGAMQHTNFIDKKHYGENHLAYVYNYVALEDPLIKMDRDELIKFYALELKKINPKFKISPEKSYMFKGPFSQPIFDKDFLKNKPNFETPVKNFYIANLDMTYPYDRGTNYAVKLGREVSLFFK